MNDAINRKDTIGAILSIGHIAELRDGDAVIRVSAVNYVLRNLPSAQPEIIHCKDCVHQEKYWHEDKRRKNGGMYIYGCELVDGYSHVCLDDDFCSRGERNDRT